MTFSLRGEKKGKNDKGGKTSGLFYTASLIFISFYKRAARAYYQTEATTVYVYLDRLNIKLGLL